MSLNLKFIFVLFICIHFKKKGKNMPPPAIIIWLDYFISWILAIFSLFLSKQFIFTPGP